ncbi:MAG: hypothetical protein JWO91_1224 [Acidobacteriaceae bacterium]|jgi:hypothetical protein|nr:hypothetical protein [Acidobacteriaceae bacterium]
MLRIKSLLIRVEIDQVQKAHNCQASAAHRLANASWGNPYNSAKSLALNEPSQRVLLSVAQRGDRNTLSELAT